MQAATAKMLREEVTEIDIADIISKWSGIPVTKLVASERSKLLGLSDELHKRVIGQNEAVEAVADAIQRSALIDFASSWLNLLLYTPLMLLYIIIAVLVCSVHATIPNCPSVRTIVFLTMDYRILSKQSHLFSSFHAYCTSSIITKAFMLCIKHVWSCNLWKTGYLMYESSTEWVRT